MLKIILIRHAKTTGNDMKRYIGSTDEHLSDLGLLQASLCHDHATYREPEVLFTSPLLRCTETAKILFPKTPPIVVDDFRETNFGDYENKTAEELRYEPAYQRFIDYDGITAFPNGESRGAVARRVIPAFEQVIAALIAEPLDAATFVVHGGTIMTILEHYVQPKKDFYHWQVENCGGYLVCIDESTWETDKKLKVFKQFHAT